MGIFDKLINKVLDLEIPGTKKTIPAVEFRRSDSEQKKDDDKFMEIAEGIIAEIAQSGYFKAEKLPMLSEMVHRITRPGYGYLDPFSYEDCLTLDEKKALGLNTRQKYSREMVECFSDAGLHHENPKEILKVLYYKIFHKISRKYELIRMKEVGIKTVKIEDCGDERDCQKIKKLKKLWPIDQVPELPLSGCTSEYCRCSYIAHNAW
jgi:hypothetical protein